MQNNFLSRNVFLVVTLFVVCHITEAEALTLEKAGVKTGVAFSQVEFSHYGRSDWYTGLASGVFVSIEIVPSLLIQPQLLYIRRGGDFKNLSETPEHLGAEVDKISFRLDYIEIPVLVWYYLNKNPKFRTGVVLGPVFGKTVSEKYNQDGYTGVGWLGGTDIGIMVGLGSELNVSGLEFSLEFL